MSVIEAEDSYIEDLNQLGDWFLQYEYLLAISADAPHVTKEERTEENRVHGCQSNAWLVLSCSEGRVFVRADSDALIVRGILSIAVSLLNGRTPEEILAYRPRYIGETNIKRQISTDRFHGIQAAIGMIQRFAAVCQTGGES